MDREDQILARLAELDGEIPVKTSELESMVAEHRSLTSELALLQEPKRKRRLWLIQGGGEASAVALATLFARAPKRTAALTAASTAAIGAALAVVVMSAPASVHETAQEPGVGSAPGVVLSPPAGRGTSPIVVSSSPQSRPSGSPAGASAVGSRVGVTLPPAPASSPVGPFVVASVRVTLSPPLLPLPSVLPSLPVTLPPLPSPSLTLPSLPTPSPSASCAVDLDLRLIVGLCVL